MPPRSSWKGFLKLSLVSVPVKAYSASSTSGEIRLNQLHKDTMQRIRYQKVVNGSSEPVPSDDIVLAGREHRDDIAILHGDTGVAAADLLLPGDLQRLAGRAG